MKNLKTILSVVFLAVFVIITVIFGMKAADLYPRVRMEMAMTPSPTPLYGNVLVVTPDPSAATQVPALRMGSIGNAVIQLQTRLQELGYNPGNIDGVFGAATEDALISFQSQNGLEPDGIAGAVTYAILYSDRARAYTEPVPTPVVTPVPVAEPSKEVSNPEEVSDSEEAARTKMYEPGGFPLLVNKTVPLAESYEPYELVELNTYCPSEIVRIKYDSMYAEKEAVDALLPMLEDAIAQGEGNWQISAAYRTTGEQQYLFDRQVRTYMEKNGLSRSKAISATRKTVADPGTSEHHIGLAFDMTIPGKSFGSTSQSKWLAEHCWEYGFVIRYTEEKKNLTGFLAEPWHIRYVGKEHSLIMRDENLCLEEYLDMYGNMIIEDSD